MLLILRQVVTQTTSVMPTQKTVFLAVCSHNQSDEDLAMSIKWRSSFSPQENAKGGKFFCKGGEKFLGKIGLKELYPLCSRLTFSLPSRFLKPVSKGKSSKVLHNLTERFDSI